MISVLNFVIFLNMNRRIIIINSIVLWGLLCTVSLYGNSLPDELVSLRDSVYAQQMTAEQLEPLYNRAYAAASAVLSDSLRYEYFSRCDYLIGRAYQYEEDKDTAADYFQKGIDWAEKSLEKAESDTGYQMLAENISQSCAVRPVSYAMANGLKVESYAKKALAINPQNAACQYIMAARYVYAPSPFHNYNKGIKMLQAILDNPGQLEKDDLFNVYSSVGYCYFQQKKYADAASWFEKSLTVYPTNKFVLDLLNKCR